MGVLFALCFWRFGLTPDTPVAALYSSVLVALALIDAEHFILPNRITYPFIVIGLALSAVVTFTNLPSSLLGAAAGASILLALIGIWWLWRGEQGMGFGDVKMLAMLGAFLGLQGVAVSLFLAALTGSAIGLALVARSGGTLRTRLPFGVFLSVGGLIALFAGRYLVLSYLRLF